ncbi:MAG: hypothetical protein DRQ61_05945 [Gammaproteobacteria bacterium]|nr:MAG: hypothetical protein DRQ61_05945 [Gammaproteobacteria bacterium]
MKPVAIRVINLLLALIIGALLSLEVVTAYLESSINEKTEIKPLHFTEDNLKFLLNQGEVKNNSFSVHAFTNGLAVISSGQINLSAKNYPFLKYSLNSNSTVQPTFFARTAGNPNTLMRAALPDNRAGIIDLGTQPQWAGQIIEVGFLFEGKQGDSFELKLASLEKASLKNHWRLLINQWLKFEPWSQYSINFSWGGAKYQATPLPLVVTIWIVFSTLTFVFLNKLSSQPWHQNRPAILIIFACGWLLLDARWLFNATTQMNASQQTYAGLNETQKLAKGLDAHIFTGMQKLKQTVLPQTPVKIILLSDPETQLYYALRARYHLAPHNVYSTHQLPAKKQLHTGQYILVIGELAGFSYNRFRSEITWKSNTRIQATRVHRGDYGQLFLLQ